ncbi:MAG: ABC transporter permease [Proteobacteria bacterium]|nr:ABC transporter permease [Pseudomonadota bacterium]
MLDLLAESTFISSIPRFVAPILLAAQGGALCQRAGVFNIALEGKMLGAAFAAVAASYATQSAVIGVLAAVLTGALAGLVFAVVSVWKRADSIVVSIALNLLISGLTAFALRAVFGVKGAFDDPRIAALTAFDVPLLADVPLLGPLFTDQTALVWLSVAVTALMHVFLFHHPWGLRLRGVGENPLAARSMGVSVTRAQTGALIVCGVLCGLAGAQLSIGAVSLFVEDMVAGRGWIAVVAVMLAVAHPWGVALVALLFGTVDSLSFRIQGVGAPQQFTEMLPYLATLIALILAALKRKHDHQDRSSQVSRHE